jgi:hypothetical protein
MIGILFAVAVPLLLIISLWIIVNKAGRPGVSQIIPIWNFIELVRISGRPLWWVVLILLIPIVDLVLFIIVWVDICKAFGKSGAYVLGIIFLPFIFLPILAFEKNTYTKPVEAS